MEIYEKYMNYLKQYPSLSSYNYIGKKVDQICNNVIEEKGQKELETLHKKLLLFLIKENEDKVMISEYPDGIKNLFKINFNRIRSEIKTNNYPGGFLYSNDKFRKDLALCSLRLIPVGARKIHLSALSKRFLIKNGLSQFIDGLYYIIFHLKGTRPIFQMHIDSKDPNLLKEFNEEGWIRSYVLIAEILKRNAAIKGVCGTSWFYDPVISEISPHLSFCRQIATKNGAKIFYSGQDYKTISNAILKSKFRKQLYNEGKYTPKNYTLIWSSYSLIRWSELLKSKQRTSKLFDAIDDATCKKTKDI